MEIRLASNTDIAGIRKIARQAYIKYVPRIGRVPAPMAADFQSYVLSEQTHVAEIDGCIVGYLIAYARDEDYFVENIAVDPGAAGQGVGRALMNLAEEHARAAHRDKLVLYTNVRMHENFPFYTALGYRTTGLVKEAGFRRVYFEKDLLSDES